MRRHSAQERQCLFPRIDNGSNRCPVCHYDWNHQCLQHVCMDHRGPACHYDWNHHQCLQQLCMRHGSPNWLRYQGDRRISELSEYLQDQWTHPTLAAESYAHRGHCDPECYHMSSKMMLAASYCHCFPLSVVSAANAVYRCSHYTLTDPRLLRALARMFQLPISCNSVSAAVTMAATTAVQPIFAADQNRGPVTYYMRKLGFQSYYCDTGHYCMQPLAGFVENRSTWQHDLLPSSASSDESAWSWAYPWPAMPKE
mmetsp:Transcript_54382/g.138147  ORF Transcript_54382/g.138147 Transcript_54382/m.138147 type:complete len:255 (+) Transcript_54382:757-1521(+)